MRSQGHYSWETCAGVDSGRFVIRLRVEVKHPIRAIGQARAFWGSTVERSFKRDRVLRAARSFAEIQEALIQAPSQFETALYARYGILIGSRFPRTHSAPTSTSMSNTHSHSTEYRWPEQRGLGSHQLGPEMLGCANQRPPAAEYLSTSRVLRTDSYPYPYRGRPRFKPPTRFRRLVLAFELPTNLNLPSRAL